MRKERSREGGRREGRRKGGREKGGTEEGREGGREGSQGRKEKEEIKGDGEEIQRVRWMWVWRTLIQYDVGIVELHVMWCGWGTH